MKRSTLTLLVLAALVVALVPAPLAAQGGNPDQPRAPKPAGDGLPVPPQAPDWSGTWQYGPDTGFQFTRFDGGLYPGDGMVYFMGGRLYDGNTDGSVWSFDPAGYGYADMGVDLVTPISNYTMNLLQDAAGNWGFYVFCGRKGDGSQSLSAQVYYPDTNATVELDPADNYPGEASCSSALNVVYDNKVWLAGGFSGTANTAQTWVFDPTAPVGSKWTQVTTANLSIPRAYIMGAVVDDLIYAIGGNWFDGSGLINVATVEVLDPNDPAPTWDDASAADLPEECSSSRAYGFDADSPYYDPDGTPMAGRIVSGCGFWADENERVYVYDTAYDYWEAFPFLNTDRRDQAGELIPSPGGGKESGIPALWMWGGRKDSDSNVLLSSEYYDLVTEAAECDVLLVDDDWDFDSPNGGGRPYYTTALDALGATYDIWDTVSMGTPTFADMGPYEVVIWFTGYDWQTPVTAEEEAELILYLDNGGNVLMSNQEQFYAFGMTPLWNDYFWVADYVEDVDLRETEGNPADPLYAGLGPYAMDRPDAFDVYWPMPPNEGLYDDEVWVNAGGFEPMLYTADDAPNGTRFEGAGFRTVYLGYPLEWLVDVDARAEVIGTALDWFCEAGPGGDFQLIPPGQAGSGLPGEAVDYTLTLVNNLGFDETFDIGYAWGLWPISGPASVGPVPDGGSQDFVVTVTIPPDAGCWEVDLAEVAAAAQSDPGLSDVAYIETTALPAGEGNLEGHVYDLNTGLGIADAYVTIEIGDEYYADTHTDASGFYSIAAIPACLAEGSFAAYGYYLEYPVEIQIEAGTTTVYDASLAASDPAWSPPDGLSMTLPPDSSATAYLTVENNGSGDLAFHLSEVPDDAGYPLSARQPALPHGVDPQVYADLAASPQGTGKFIVYMAEQADLSAAFQIEDWSARGQYVFDTLRQTAERSQADLRTLLAELDRPFEPHYIINALVVEGDANLVNGLSTRQDVAYIGANAAVEAPAPSETGVAIEAPETVVWNIQQVNADDVWSTFGATGQGITVANIDTGVDYDHPALTNQYRGNLGGGNYDHNYNWWDPYGYGPTEPYDHDNHGSHTMGTMIGDDGGENQIGMAPDGTWFACQGFDMNTGYGYTAELMTCGEFILAPWDLNGMNPDPALRADVVNNSWGGGQAQWWYNQIVYAWRAAGIFPAWSIGNDGPNCGTAGDPGDMANNIAAGATDSNDLIAGFSSRGPAVVTEIIKPNVAAPGVNTISAYNGGTYGLMSGTSMASPHLAGEVALLWSAVPELRGDVQLTQWVIEQSALDILDSQCGDPGPPNNVYGWGRIDAFEAVSLASSGNWDIPWLSIDPEGGTVAPGGSADVAFAFDSTGQPLGCQTAQIKVEFNDPYVTELFYPVELCVVSGETMHVGGMEGYFSLDTMGRPRLRIHVYVEDGSLAPLADVLVTASIWVPDGGPFERMRYTKPSGNARFHWGSNASGTWTLCVDDLELAGYVYVPGDNVVTCMDWEH